MKRTCRSTRKGQRSPLEKFIDATLEREPDPIIYGLYRIVPPGRRRFLDTLEWDECSRADIEARFGGGKYQIVQFHRGREKYGPVFEIAGPPLYGRT